MSIAALTDYLPECMYFVITFFVHQTLAAIIVFYYWMSSTFSLDVALMVFNSRDCHNSLFNVQRLKS